MADPSRDDVDDLTNPESVVRSLTTRRHFTALALVLETTYSQIAPQTLLEACAFLAPTPSFPAVKPEYLSLLESDFPVPLAAIRSCLLLQNVPSSQIEERCHQAIALIKATRIEGQPDPILNYNLAFLNAKLKRKEKAMKYAKLSILSATAGPPPASAVLLLLRILRSNCQPDDAVALAVSSRDLLDCYDRNILIEGMFAAVESGDLSATEQLFQLLRSNFKDDPVALNASVMLNLMLGKTESAAECFERGL
jgi:hypothetical protein